MPTWLTTTVSIVVGGALTMVSTWIADRRLSQREQERRREDRREHRAIRRDDFQRETLLALQLSSQRLLRTAGAMHYQDVVAFRKTGHWQRQQLPDGLSNDELQLSTETMLLASRVRDDQTRSLAKQLRERAISVGHSPDEDAAESRMLAAADTQQALIDRIGELIRDLDESE